MKAAESSPKLRLTVELVPKRSWGRDLAKLAPRAAWEAVRQHTFKRHDGQCAICGAAAKHAHEVWEYRDATHAQQLKDIIPLCELCHLVKHFGRTGILVRQGKVNGAAVIQHFLKVNGCDRSTFEQHVREACALWEQRSQHAWTIDWGPYAQLVSQC